MTVKEATQKIKDSKELILALGTVIAVIIGGLFWLQDTLYEREMAIIEKHSELLSDALIEKIQEKIDPVNTEEFYAVIDCVLVAQNAHAEANEEMHLRTLRRQDTILLSLEAQTRRDTELQLQIEFIQSALDLIQGVSEKTQEEQREFALTDSLQSELIRLKTEQYNRERMRQMEQQHKEELRQIREAAKDDGKTKVINVKPRKGKNKKEFKDRVLLPL